jgi:hypothetical protein
MNGLEYNRYITSAYWLARRDAYWRSHPKICQACGSGDDIQLHHQTYERVGHELDEDLVPLCQVCHSLVHQRHRERGGSLITATQRVVKSIQKRTIRYGPPPPRSGSKKGKRKAAQVSRSRGHEGAGASW